MKLSLDLHIHSALSPCCDNEMTPNNIVNMAYLKGLDVISVTDHNSMLNVKPVIELAKDKGIIVIPGIEITAKEDVHVLCYFNNLENGLKFQDIVYDGLPDILNRKDIFGEQLIFDVEDSVKGKVDKLLINSTKYSLYEINRLSKKFDGVIVPAHIDRKSYGILSVLGFIPEDLKVGTLEISQNCDMKILKELIDLSIYKIIRNSDAHYLKDINEPVNFIYPKEKNMDSILDYLRM